MPVNPAILKQRKIFRKEITAFDFALCPRVSSATLSTSWKLEPYDTQIGRFLFGTYWHWQHIDVNIPIEKASAPGPVLSCHCLEGSARCQPVPQLSAHTPHVSAFPALLSSISQFLKNDTSFPVSILTLSISSIHSIPSRPLLTVDCYHWSA